MVDRSSISLAVSAAGLTGPAALMRMVRTSSRLQCLLVETRDDPMEPGDAHAEAGTASAARSSAIACCSICAPSLTSQNVAYTTQYQ
jgi:hypothetical protein